MSHSIQYTVYSASTNLRPLRLPILTSKYGTSCTMGLNTTWMWYHYCSASCVQRCACVVHLVILYRSKAIIVRVNRKYGTSCGMCGVWSHYFGTCAATMSLNNTCDTIMDRHGTYNDVHMKFILSSCIDQKQSSLEWTGSMVRVAACVEFGHTISVLVQQPWALTTHVIPLWIGMVHTMM